jgi:DNA polymerase III delta prime subunit
MVSVNVYSQGDRTFIIGNNNGGSIHLSTEQEQSCALEQPDPIFGSYVNSEIDWAWADTVLRSKQLPQIEQKLNAICDENRLFSIFAHERLDLVLRETSKVCIPKQTTIDIFERKDIAGSLLILGEPGAGKTTELLRLAKYLVEKSLSNPKKVIPIIFELSAWRDTEQSIDDWMIDQLCKYVGGECKRHVYEKWLEHQILLPLFDGLDELGLKIQEKCTLKLNELAAKYSRMVICCRIEEFEILNISINLRGAIVLQHLNSDQIKNYLKTIGLINFREYIVHNQQMAQMLEPDEYGRPGILQVPLFLSFAVENYDGVIPFTNKEEFLKQYIEKKLLCDVKGKKRDISIGRKWACQKSRFLLSWLAGRLKERNQVDFLIEKIQLDWLDVNLVWRYKFLLTATVYLVVKNFFVYPSDMLFSVLIVLLIMKQDICLSQRPLERAVSETATKTLVWEETWKGNLVRAIFGFFVGSFWGIGCGLIAWMIGGINIGISCGTVLGIASGLMLGICSCLISTEIGNYRKIIFSIRIPNQGTYETLINALWITPLAYILGVVVIHSPSFVKGALVAPSSWVELLQRSISNIYHHPQIPCIFALYVFLFIVEGKSLIKHLCLRIVLFRQGVIPWNYARFLNYCSERRILQCVGGRYRFIHPEIFCYMAQCEK